MIISNQCSIQSAINSVPIAKGALVTPVSVDVTARSPLNTLVSKPHSASINQLVSSGWQLNTVPVNQPLDMCNETAEIKRITSDGRYSTEPSP